MTVLVVIISLMIGAALTEWFMRSMNRPVWLSRRLQAAQVALRAFHHATHDDLRQKHLIQAGLATLALSLSILGRLAVAGVVVLAPLALPLDQQQLTLYLLTSTVSAVGWWMLRRRRFR